MLFHCRRSVRQHCSKHRRLSTRQPINHIVRDTSWAKYTELDIFMLMFVEVHKFTSPLTPFYIHQNTCSALTLVFSVVVFPTGKAAWNLSVPNKCLKRRAKWCILNLETALVTNAVAQEEEITPAVIETSAKSSLL